MRFSEVQETDFSSFLTTPSDTVGYITVRSKKGPRVPVGILNENDCITYFGTPSADYPSVFEAIEYARYNKCWVVSAVADDALYGGVDVRSDGIEGFGAGCGRIYETFNGYTAIKRRPANTSAGPGNGSTATFSGTIAGISGTVPINGSSLQILVGGTAVAAVESSGSITGSAISGTGTLGLTSGAYNFTFAGSAGTAAAFTTTISGTTFDLSSGTKHKAVNVQIDSVLYANIDLGISATASQASIISAINAAVGSTVATANGNFIDFDGVIMDAVYGNIRISNPSDTTTYDSALTIVFDTAAVSVTGTNPTGSIPRYNQAVALAYTTTSNQAANVSHSFFCFSPYSDTDLGAIVTATSSRDFILDLYTIQTTGYALQDSYSYSLDQKKDGFGNSLYITDVFKYNPHVIPYVNSAFTGTVSFTTPVTQVDLTGGDRGSDPTSANYLTAWNYAQKALKYRSKTFLDVIGNSPVTIVSIRNTYQPWAFCASMIPMGNDATAAVAYRQGLAIDDDQIAFYTNWTEIKDPYNNSYAWTSRLGAVGKIYADKVDGYDAPSPAGVDLNLEGGQISSGFTPIQTEFEYSAAADIDTAYSAQVNMIVLDPDYGLMLIGDKTAKATNSDTSFIGTRRMYNLIIDTIKTQVLRQQVFKFNNATNRRRAYTLTNEFLIPIVNGEYLNSATVVCDESNNTAAILNQRKFVLGIYVQATPNSQEVILQFTRLANGVSVVDFLPKG